ncbi:MAG TPA: YraN family protein [Chitinophagales bacterium]|nr:YraN family protein [Chitinophagales bacterium]HMZ95127.1 YraN family protein [Chitinophagales bacterium]HNJ11800.1 YraN family protein [Chitinophagales bacterium]
MNKLTSNQKIGINGEAVALNFLKNLNYTILHTNWRHKHSEIDIIAQDGNCIVFIEVKTRNSNKFGYPEEFVTANKIKKMHEAADAFLEQTNWQNELRFDIIAIENYARITHFIDAFY